VIKNTLRRFKHSFPL